MSRPKPLSDRAQKVLLSVLAVLLVARAGYSVASAEGMDWDFTNYYNTGARVYHGEWENIYNYEAPIGGNPRELVRAFPYLGAPISALVFAPLGAFPERPALFLFKLSCLLCYAAAFWILFRHLSKFWKDKSQRGAARVAYLSVLLVCEPAWRVFAVGGQSTPLAFLLFVVFWEATENKKFWLAGGALCAAMLLKPFLVAMLMPLLIGWQIPLLVRWLACVCVAGILSAAVMGVQIHFEWIEMIRWRGGLRALPWWYNSSPSSFFSNFWFHLNPPEHRQAFPLSLEITITCLRLGLMLLVAWLTWSGMRSAWPEQRKRTWLLTCAISAALFFPYTVWAHYLVFLMPPLLLWAVELPALPRLAQWLLLAMIPAALRGNQTLARTLSRRFLEIDTIPEVALVGLYGCGVLLLMLLLLLCLRPRAQTVPASLAGPGTVPGAPGGTPVQDFS